MTFTTSVFLMALLFTAELVYLGIARKFGLFDEPNERSLHTSLSIVQGGGIVFWIASLLAFFYEDFTFPYFFAGLTLVSAVSFIDDFRPLANRYRLGVQSIGMGFLLYRTGLSDTFWVICLIGIVGVGILNAYNFMDGINGITAFYSLVTIGTLWYLQPHRLMASPDNDLLLPFTFCALLVFSWFNARRQAICFAGDVGSVSIAFIILYALMQCMETKHTYLPILFLAVYGVDTVLTIIHRLYLRQNIFHGHRFHLFQLLVYKLGWPHLRVSFTYMLIQLIVNGLVIMAMKWPVTNQLTLAGAILSVLTAVYGVVKSDLMTVEIKKAPAPMN